MNIRAVGFLILALWGSVRASDAQGALKITFDHSPSGGPGTDYLTDGYYESGLYFTRAPGSYGFGLVGWNCQDHPDDGSAYLQVGNGNGVMFADLDAPVFSISSVDLSDFRTTSPHATSVSFIGYRLDGSTVSTSFTTGGAADGPGGVSDFQTFNFGSDWTDLTRVEVPGVTTPNQGWSMDNLVFIVPEPGMGALFVLGAVAFQFRRMKRARTGSNCNIR